MIEDEDEDEDEIDSNSDGSELPRIGTELMSQPPRTEALTPDP